MRISHDKFKYYIYGLVVKLRMEFKDYIFCFVEINKTVVLWGGFHRITLQSSMDLKLTNCYTRSSFFSRRAFVCEIEERTSQIGKYYVNEI